MPFLYRTPIIISRKQPYVDWANSLMDDEAVEFTIELARKRDIYLGPSNDYQQTLDQALTEIWQEIFEEELYGWSTDEAQWPDHRTRKMFDEWFEAELAESIIDLVPGEPLTEDEVEIDAVEAAALTCGWCLSEVAPEGGRTVSFKLSKREMFESRAGRVLPLPIRRDRMVAGVVTMKDSAAAKAGADLVVRACSRRCEKQLLKAVPRALRELEEQIASNSSSPAE